MSTDTTPHTPTPWYVGGHPCDGSGSDWREILTNALPYQPHFIATALKADAELIVQAVNERESLVAERDALRQALEQVADIPAVAFSRDQFEMAKRTVARMQEIARAALAQGRDK